MTKIVKKWQKHVKLLKHELKIINIYIYIYIYTYIHVCDPLCENPAIFSFAVFYKKIILHTVKNILWKYNLYICNIDWVRSC